MILKTFLRLIAWSDDLQQQFVYFFMLRSVELPGLDRGVTKTSRLSTVPVSGPDTSRQCDVGNIPHKNTHFTDIYGVL